MKEDKKDYHETLEALIYQGKLVSIINKLNKVYVTTEDAILREQLSSVIAHLNRIELDQVKKSQLTSLLPMLNDQPYKEVVEYCKKCIQSVKAQWQIIAEKHGWGPTP